MAPSAGSMGTQSKKSKMSGVKKDVNFSLYVLGLLGLIVALILSYSFVFTKTAEKNYPAKPSSFTSETLSKPSSKPLKKRPAPGSTTEYVGNKILHPSFGIFPKDCRWRPVQEVGNSTFDYVYWDKVTKTWNEERPAACAPTGHLKPGPPKWNFRNGTPRSEVSCPDSSHCLYHNLYYNRGRWYALVDGPDFISNWRFSRNQEISTIHVEDAWDFVDSVKWSVIPGDTIIFDFIYFVHPTAIGHWWEMLGPLFSTFKTTTFKLPCDQFILLHLQRRHMLEWVRAMIAVTLGVKVNDELPPVYIQEATESAWEQITSQLEGLDKDTWYIFERVIITKDLYTGGGRTFTTYDAAKEFRGLIYQQYGLPPPQPRQVIPRIITYQRKRANRRILNEEAFIEMLKEFGELQVVEYNETSSLYEQLLQMRKTGVFISVHTSNLANAPLLQPGSAVFEILQRNWHWNGLDTSFRDQTTMMGDIHHYAWRAQRRNETFYLNERDMVKVSHWPPEICGTEECVEAHTKVDVLVDIPAFRALLEDRLPFVWNNTFPYFAKIEWPPAVDRPEDAEANSIGRLSP
ncbi:hypothetical protein CEUSTIGMA_g7486.t1 [Chlamydomonas eustigma]|uniref:Glycosyltransferase 61 catalytic domain-containing protein n=1 Tax=Chlamydomonas eustigma TaxID=1157962 RepID=A0A250XAE3_9CHLO|nr:hypothetical protein CEUSTIGMA_g7486.t1 [Chlamydomonas eustigma]|eukprot:GAX80047.1 hypothetical protein CEUSTIGMA_g7486.t1 [Chlamydomonas eustigma]